MSTLPLTGYLNYTGFPVGRKHVSNPIPTHYDNDLELSHGRHLVHPPAPRPDSPSPFAWQAPPSPQHHTHPAQSQKHPSPHPQTRPRPARTSDAIGTSYPPPSRLTIPPARPSVLGQSISPLLRARLPADHHSATSETGSRSTVNHHMSKRSRLSEVDASRRSNGADRPPTPAIAPVHFNHPPRPANPVARALDRPRPSHLKPDAELEPVPARISHREERRTPAAQVVQRQKPAGRAGSMDEVKHTRDK